MAYLSLPQGASSDCVARLAGISNLSHYALESRDEKGLPSSFQMIYEHRIASNKGMIASALHFKVVQKRNNFLDQKPITLEWWLN